MLSIMFTGVAGVGKSTIVREVATHLNLPHGDYADFMLHFINGQSKDDIQALDWSRRVEIYRKLDAYIQTLFCINDGDQHHYLLENHLTVISKEKVQTFPPDVFRKYNMAGLCVIEAPAEMILARRRDDRSRTRPIDTQELIRSQQNENALQAEKVAAQYNLPLLRLENIDGERAAEEAIQWVFGIIGYNDTR